MENKMIRSIKLSKPLTAIKEAMPKNANAKAIDALLKNSVSASDFYESPLTLKPITRAANIVSNLFSGKVFKGFYNARNKVERADIISRFFKGEPLVRKFFI